MENRERLVIIATHFRTAKEELCFAHLHLELLGGFDTTMTEVKQTIADLNSSIGKIEEFIS